MSTLLASVDKTKLKIRWKETYVSEGLDRALASLGRGIVYGFTPMATGGYNLRLAKNTDRDLSLAIWYDETDHLAVAYSETAQLNYDLTAFAGTTIYVGLTVDYTVGVETSGEIRAYTQLEYDAAPDVLWLLCVDVPAGPGPLVESNFRKYPRDMIWQSVDDPSSEDWQQVIYDPGPFFPETWLQTNPTGNIAVGTDASVHSGIFSWKFRQTGAAAGTVTIYPGTIFRAMEGEGILFSIWKRMVNVNVAEMTVRLYVTYYNIAGAAIGSGFVLLEEAGTVAWAQRKGQFRAPANSVYAIASIVATTTGATASEVYVQDLKVFVEKQRVSQYGEGVGAPVMTSLVQFWTADLAENAIMRFLTSTAMVLLPDTAGSYTFTFGDGTRLFQVRANSFGYVAVKQRVERYFAPDWIETLAAWAPNAGTLEVCVIAMGNWIGMKITAGDIVGFPIKLNKGEEIDKIILGVEAQVGIVPWDFDLFRANLATGGAVLESSPLAVASVACPPGDPIQPCEFNISGDHVASTVDGGDLLILQIQTAHVPPVDAHLIYIEVWTHYSTVEAAVNGV